jgi:hypothetical protein
MDLPLGEGDRRLLAATLLGDAEELSPERVEGAIRALRKIHLKRRLDHVQREIQGPAKKEIAHLQSLLQERVRLKRALMDPSLGDDGISGARKTGS